jgi:hypothetical protein
MAKMYCTDCRPTKNPELVCYYEDDSGKLRVASYETFITLPEEYDWHCSDCGALIEPPWTRMARVAREILQAETPERRLEVAHELGVTDHDLELRGLDAILSSVVGLRCHKCACLDLAADQIGEAEDASGYTTLRAGDPVAALLLSVAWPWMCTWCHEPVYVPAQTAMAAAALAADREE